MKNTTRNFLVVVVAFCAHFLLFSGIKALKIGDKDACMNLAEGSDLEKEFLIELRNARDKAYSEALSHPKVGSGGAEPKICMKNWEIEPETLDCKKNVGSKTCLEWYGFAVLRNRIDEKIQNDTGEKVQSGAGEKVQNGTAGGKVQSGAGEKVQSGAGEKAQSGADGKTQSGANGKVQNGAAGGKVQSDAAGGKAQSGAGGKVKDGGAGEKIQSGADGKAKNGAGEKFTVPITALVGLTAAIQTLVKKVFI